MEKIGKILPYPRWRKGQEKIARKVYEAVRARKILLLGYPTGAGKTIAALIGAYLSKPKSKKIFFLARTKNQVQAPIREVFMLQKKGVFVSTIVLQNKRDMCPLPISGRLSYEEFLKYCDSLNALGLCQYFKNLEKVDRKKLDIDYNPEPRAFIEEISRKGLCPYEIAKMLVSKSDLIIGSYTYIFSRDIRYRIQTATGLKLEDLILIIDEAHNLPDIIADMQSTKIYKHYIKIAQKEVRKFLKGEMADSLISSLTNLYSYITTLEKKSGGEDYILDPSELLAVFPSFNQLKNATFIVSRNMLESGILTPSYLSKIYEFLKALYHMTYGFVVYATTTSEGFTIKCQCVDPTITSRDVFSKVYAAILMSGTLQPTDYLVSMLGLERRRIIEHRIRADFSKQVKLLVYTRLSSRYVERSDENYKRIAKIITILFKKLSSDVALAVFPSYEYMKKVNVFLPDEIRKNSFPEREDTRLRDVEEFIKKRGKSLVLAVAWGKLIEGIELRRERSLIKMVILAGLPVPEPSIVNVKKEELLTARFLDAEKGWKYTYIVPAVIRLLQAIGRAVRTEEDRAFVLILDRRIIESDLKSIVEIHGYKMETTDKFNEIVEKLEAFDFK